MILPEVSLAEGLIFVEEVYSSIHSLKALYPNVLLLDNNNNSYGLDIDYLDYLILQIT